MLKKVLLLTLLPAVISAPVPALAASPKPSGITLSPAFQQVIVKSDEASHPLTFKVTNHEKTAQVINLSTQDFNTLSETGGLLFVGANPTDLQKKYGLAKWLALDTGQINLAPGQTATISAKILNLPDMSPGGHYGALMLSLNGSSKPGQNKVSLQPIASSLLFVTKTGGDTHKLALSGVNATHSFFSLPGSVVLRFSNNGNTHLVPRGVVTIIDSKNKIVRKGIINSDSNIILPQTARHYFVPLNQVSEASGIGQYKLRVDFRFDGIIQYRSYQQSLRLVPAYFIGLIAALLIAAAAAAYIKRQKPAPKAPKQPKK